MDLLHNFTVKSEKAAFKSDGETKDLDFMVKIEIEADEFIQNYYDEIPCLKVEELSFDSADGSQDSSFSSLQEFYREECMFCHKVFFNRYRFIEHNSTHLKVPIDFPKAYQCDYCSVYFVHKGKLTDHIHSKHSEENNNHVRITKRIHSCTICQKEFKYRHWKEHMNSVHGTERYECSICNVAFTCIRYLKKHNRFHHEGSIRKKYERKPGPYKCKLCPKTFQSNDCLNKHVFNCHSDPVECNICKSRLKSTAYLRAHMRRVHYNDGKVHKCEICSKEFKSPRYVRVHIKNTHARMDRTPHGSYKSVSMSCECGESFRRVRMLENHLKICAVSLKLTEINGTE